KVNRYNGALSLGLEMPEFPLGDVAAGAADRFAPELAPHLAGLTATAAVSADLSYTPDAARPWHHDVRLDLKDARFKHPDLPWPAEKLAATMRVVDGRLKVDEATAVVNGAKVKLSLETRADPPSRDAQRSAQDEPLKRLEDHLQRLDLTVCGV